MLSVLLFLIMENRNTYLFIWNQKYWPIEKLMPVIDEFNRLGIATDEWRIAGHRKVKVGDRAFITRANDKQKGIFASGTIIKKDVPIPDKGRFIPGVQIEFDVFLNPLENRLDIELVKENMPILKKWPPQSSGTQVVFENAIVLEKLWNEFISSNSLTNLVDHKTITEGTPYQVIQNVYERNRQLRVICLGYYGYSCVVCDFNFEDTYGELGKEFIHVHHLNQLSATGITNTDPLIDLRPVCPNCHAMLHKRNPPYTIEELKGKLLRT